MNKEDKDFLEPPLEPMMMGWLPPRPEDSRTRGTRVSTEVEVQRDERRLPRGSALLVVFALSLAAWAAIWGVIMYPIASLIP